MNNISGTQEATSAGNAEVSSQNNDPTLLFASVDYQQHLQTFQQQQQLQQSPMPQSFDLRKFKQEKPQTGNYNENNWNNRAYSIENA